MTYLGRGLPTPLDFLASGHLENLILLPLLNEGPPVVKQEEPAGGLAVGTEHPVVIQGEEVGLELDAPEAKAF